MGVVADLVVALESAFPGTTVVGNPVDVVPMIPSIVVYPDSPLMDPGEYCSEQMHLQVVVYGSRANEVEAMDIAAATVTPMRQAVNQVQGSWDQMDLQPVDSEGNTYLGAVHSVTLYGSD